jgi:hypothetical protein
MNTVTTNDGVQIFYKDCKARLSDRERRPPAMLIQGA